MLSIGISPNESYLILNARSQLTWDNSRHSSCVVYRKQYFCNIICQIPDRVSCSVQLFSSSSTRSADRYFRSVKWRNFIRYCTPGRYRNVILSQTEHISLPLDQGSQAPHAKEEHYHKGRLQVDTEM